MEVNHGTWDREYGGVAVFFAWELWTVGVGACELTETDEVVASPTFPCQFEMTLVEDGFECGNGVGHEGTVSHEVQFCSAVFSVSQFCLCHHEEHVGIAEEDDVVVTCASVGVGVRVGGVLAESCSCQFDVWAASEVEFHFPRVIDQWGYLVVHQNDFSVLVDGVGVEGNVEAGILIWFAIFEGTECFDGCARPVL